MIHNNRILGIILARGGSKSIPKKNIYPIKGIPLIAFTICEGLRSKYLDRLIVSSDDEDIKEIAKSYGAEAPFNRPAELADDTATSADALLHAVQWAEKDEGEKYDYIVELMCPNPMKTAEDIDFAIEKLDKTGSDYVIGVVRLEEHHPIRIKKIENDLIVDFCVPETPETRRQDLKPDAYIRNGSIYAMKRDVLMTKKRRYDKKNARPYIFPPERSVNIDSRADLYIAESLINVEDTGHIKPKNSISLRMGAWYDDRLEHLIVPDSWKVKICNMKDGPPISDNDIRNAILNPLGTERLSILAKGKGSACIAIDDLTRPTETFRIAPFIIEELLKSGIPEANICFVVSTGTHRPLTLKDVQKKLGRTIANKYIVYSHSPYQNLIDIGETQAGTTVLINKYYYESEIKIAIGSLSPHPYAGFSGGGKIVMPGLAGIHTIEINHKPVNSGLAGKLGVIKNNTRRSDIDEAAKKAGIDFLVNTVNNSDMKTSGIAAGNVEMVFDKVVGLAESIYATDVEYNNDIGIFNAYSRDQWFLLSLNAFNVWSIRDGSHDLVRPGGICIIINECSEGLGTHHLYEKGFLHHIRRDLHGTFGHMIRERYLVFYYPNLNNRMIKDHYSDNVRGFCDWSKMVDHVTSIMPNPQSVVLYPNSSIQMDAAVLS